MKKSAQGSGLWPRIVLEGCRIPLDLVGVAQFERDIHRIGVEAQLVMTNASSRDKGLGLRQRLSLGLGLLEGVGENADYVRPVKRRSGLPAYGERPLQELDRLGPLPFGESQTPEMSQAALFEAPRSEAADELLRTPNMLVAVISLPESKEGRGGGQGGIQLSSLMTDACRSVHGDQRLRDHNPLWREKLLSLNHLGEIGDVDAAEAVLTTKLHAFAQSLVRTDHAPPHVFCIAKAAEGCCLKFDGANFTRELQALGVLL